MQPTPQQIETYNALFEAAKTAIDGKDFAQLYEAETGYAFTKRKANCVLCGSGTSGRLGSDGAMTFYPSSNLGKCYSCGTNIGTVKLLQHVHNCDYKTAILYFSEKYLHTVIENPWEQEQAHRQLKPKTDVKTISDRKRISLEEQREEEAEKERKFKYFLAITTQRQNKETATAYLKGRAIDTAKLPEGAYYEAEPYNQLPAGVVFIDSEKRLLNKRYIGSLPTGVAKSFNYGTLTNMLYDAAFIQDQAQVFVTEGVINALSFYTLGKSAVALFATTNEITDSEKFFRYFNDKEVVLAYDSDRAGLQAAMRRALWIMEEMHIAGITLLLMPQPKEGEKPADANDLLQQNELAAHLESEYNYVELYPELVKRELAAIAKDREHTPNLRPKGYYSRPAHAEETDGSVLVIKHEEPKAAEAYKALLPGKLEANKESCLGFVPVVQISVINNRRAHVHQTTPEQAVFVSQVGETYCVWRPNAQKPFKELVWLNGSKPEGHIWGLAQTQKEANELLVRQDFTEDDTEKKKGNGKPFEYLFLCFNLQDLVALRSIGQYGIYTERGLSFDMKKSLTDMADNVVIISNRDETKQRAREIGLFFLTLRTFYIQPPYRTLTHYLAETTANSFIRMLNTALPFEFWEMKKGEYAVNLIHLRHLLQAKGFYTMSSPQNRKGFIFINIDGRVVDKFIPEKDEFSRYVRGYIDEFLTGIGENSKLRNQVAKAVELNENNLGGLKQVTLDFMNSGRNFQNWFFTDGNMWTVTRAGIKMHKQTNLKKFVWKEEILDIPSTVCAPPFRIFITEEYKQAMANRHTLQTGTDAFAENEALIERLEDGEKYDIEILDPDNYFLQYLFLTGCSYWQEYEKLYGPVQKDLFFTQFEGKLESAKIKEMKRHLMSRLTWLGYIMQDFRSMEHQYGLAILDALDYEDRQKSAAGGGKSIIARGVERVKYTLFKKADREDWCSYPHRYEDYAGERVIIADDMHKLSKIGDMLTDFSLGIEVNPKHKGSVQLALNQSPKIIVTRNFIDDEGERVDRRLGRVFVYNYFHDSKGGRFKEDRTPRTVFGRTIIADDTPEQANGLVTVFAYMYVAYMNYGTINTPMGNLTLFRVANEVGEVLISFLDEYFADDDAFGYIERSVLYDAFKQANTRMSGPNMWRYDTSHKFKRLVGMYCKLRKLVFNPHELITDKVNNRIIRPSRVNLSVTGAPTNREHLYIAPGAKAMKDIAEHLGKNQPEPEATKATEPKQLAMDDSIWDEPATENGVPF